MEEEEEEGMVEEEGMAEEDVVEEKWVEEEDLIGETMTVLMNIVPLQIIIIS